jgi:two-component system sensor histidine kinase EvgS
MVKLHRRIRILVLTLLLMLSSAACLAAPTVRVGWFLVPGLQDFDAATGQYGGYNYDYLKAVAQFTGWNYEFVVEPLGDCLQDLQTGKLDLVGNMARNPEREKLFLYTNNNVGMASPRLVTRANNTRYAFEDFTAFNGMTIGLIKSSYFEKALPGYAAQHQFTYQVRLFNKPLDMEQALQNGEIDSAMISGMRTMSNTRVLAELPAEVVYFICTPHKPWLREQFDQALGLIRYFDKGFDDHVYTKYFANNFAQEAAFTVAEKQYLHQLAQENKAINVAFDPAWQPLEAKDPKTGAYVGMGRDIYDLLARKTGLKFKFQAADSFKDTIHQYGGQVDLYSLISANYDWADYLQIGLTQPILETQVFKIYGNREEKYIALPDNYYLTKAVRERLAKEGQTPAYRLYPDTGSCLDAIRNREADSTYLNSFELNYYMDKIQLEHLNIQSVEGFTIRYALGISKKADPRLMTIVSRAVNSISPNEINQIIMSRTQQRLQPSLMDRMYASPVRYFGGALAAVVLAGLLVFLYVSNRSNKQQREVLQAANQAKSEFLSRVSHDIRTPINAIISMTNFAKEDIADRAKVENELSKIETSSRYLLSLVNDVLDISKAESNKIELHPEPYPFDEFIRGLRNIFSPLCAQNGQKFVVQPGSYAPGKGVIVDRVRFDQVVMNIISNAVKYTPAGGTITYTSLSKDAGDGRISCGFTVTDTGVGMSEKFQQVMFEPFSQEHDNPGRTKMMSGTGLGLAIVKKIVDIMGGTINVQSKVGQGTSITVNFVLPRATPEQLAALRPQQGAAATLPPLQGKILLAEDNLINMEIALRILRGFGLEITSARNGQEAVNLFQASAPGTFQVVLLDIQMPVLNGYAASAQIRALPRPDAATVPIIALTADVFADAVQKSRDAGMVDHVPKPIDRQVLYTTLSKYLQPKQA